MKRKAFRGHFVFLFRLLPLLLLLLVLLVLYFFLSLLLLLCFLVILYSLVSGSQSFALMSFISATV